MKVVDASMKTDKKGREYLRVVGDLISLKCRKFNYQAGISYYGNEVEMLGNLESMLGDDVDKVIGDNGEIVPESLSLFRGKECDVEITHVTSKLHSNAFRKVAHITPPGELLDWAA